MTYTAAFALLSDPSSVDDETLLDATVRVLAEAHSSRIAATADRARRAAGRVKDANASIYWQAREIETAAR